MSKQVRLLSSSLLVLIFLAGECFGQTNHGPTTSSAKNTNLFDLQGKGASIFTFCSVSRDLFVAFSSEEGRTVYRWNVDTGRKLASYRFPKKYRCENATVSADGKILVLAAYDMKHDALHSANIVRLISVQSGRTIKEFTYDVLPARVQFSRDGQVIVTHRYTHEAGGERVYNRNGNEQKNFDLKAFDQPDLPAAWEVPNSKGGPRPGLFCRDFEGRENRLYPDDKTFWSDLRDYAISTDKYYVAASTRSGRFLIWRIPDAKIVSDFQVGSEAALVQFDQKSGRFLFASGDAGRRTWLQAVELGPRN